jgi:hypothetical protein
MGGASVTTKKQGPAVAPKRGAKKLKYVEAMLIKEDPGDGWAEVEKGGVTKSVPANYVQAV